jgi:hypothetical protein
MRKLQRTGLNASEPAAGSADPAQLAHFGVRKTWFGRFACATVGLAWAVAQKSGRRMQLHRLARWPLGLIGFPDNAMD